MKRIILFDWIRVIAIWGIVLSHFLMTFMSTSLIAGCLATSINAIFFSMSALLLGKAWCDKGRMAYQASFLVKRFSRLAVPLWLFLVAFFVVTYCLGDRFSLKSVLLNFCFLSWFAKIPGIGHLWFVTMISLLYIVFFLISRLWKRLNNNLWLFVGHSVICGFFYICLTFFGLPAYMAFILWYSVLLFVYADKILRWCDTAKVGYPFVLFAIISSLIVLSLIDLDGPLKPILYNAVGVLSLFVLLIAFRNAQVLPKWVESNSAMSYELYLVHHPFVIGPYSLGALFSNQYVFFLVYVCLSAVLALLLSWSSNRIRKMNSSL